VIDPSTLAVLDTILVQSKPNVVTFTPSGDFAYVTCADAWAVVKIDTATRTVVETIDLGEQPWGIAIHPDGGIAYVTTSSDHVLVIDLSDGSFVSIDVGHGPTGVAFTHDGAKAYVANESDGTVSVIDADTHTLTKTIALDDPSLDPPKPLEVVISPGDAVAIVPHGGAPPGYGGPIFWAVSVIDCATDAVIDTLSVGLNPRFADVWGIGY
jgi:YVTN family beta-propeller protein